MNSSVTTSLVTITLLFLFTLFVLDIKAAASGDPYPSTTRESHSLSSHANRVNDNLPLVKSIESNISGSTLLKRAKGQKSWTVEEEERLLELRGQQKSWNEIREFFPGRNRKSLLTKYARLTKDLNKPKKDSIPWTQEEKQTLLELVKAETSWEEIAKHLPRRNAKSVKAQYYRVRKEVSVPKSKRKYWTAEEHDLIVDALEKNLSVEEIAQLLNRSVVAVNEQVTILNSSSRLDHIPTMRHVYSVAELELMRRLRDEGVSWKDIASQHFPGRVTNNLAQALFNYRRRKSKNTK